MLEILKTATPSPEQWEIVIEGMRNPMNSWANMDTAVEGEKIDMGEADKAGDVYASVVCRAFAATLADFLKRCYNYEV